MKTTENTPAKSASAVGLLDEISAQIERGDATGYRAGLKDAAGFMGLVNAMPETPEKKSLQERFSELCQSRAER